MLLLESCLQTGASGLFDYKEICYKVVLYREILSALRGGQTCHDITCHDTKYLIG